MRPPRVLFTTVALALLLAALPRTAPAITRPARVQQLRYMLRSELRDLGQTIRTPNRAARLATTSAVGYAAGLATLHFVASPGSAAFVSYVTSVGADRLIDHSLPETRAFGALPPPPPARDVLQTLAGASVAGLAAPTLVAALHPVAVHLQAIGDSAPGILGLAARAVFGGTFARGLGSMGASLLGLVAHSSLARTSEARAEARAEEPRMLP